MLLFGLMVTEETAWNKTLETATAEVAPSSNAIFTVNYPDKENTEVKFFK